MERCQVAYSLVGIVGYLGNLQLEKTTLSKMIKTLEWTSNEQVASWSDNNLSIAQVSYDLNGVSQPLFSDDNSLLIMMEGHIYDYEKNKSDLIAKGHKFKYIHSDAEYCLRLFEEYGANAFERLNGCFVIAVYNLLTQELLIANDRFSSTHVFYHYLNTPSGFSLLFGTQLASIIASRAVPRELNMSAIFEFFTFQRVLGCKTYYKNINMLPPAHILKIKKGILSIEPYWVMKYAPKSKRADLKRSYYSTQLAILLKRVMERKTNDDYRHGLLLSGGLDSRMVLAATDKQMVTFTFGDYENREIKIAKKIAKTKKMKHLFLKRNPEYYVDLVDSAVRLGDGMHPFFHAHSIGFLLNIKKECDVLLHGNPPELFFRGTGLPHKRVKILGRTVRLLSLVKLNEENLPNIIISDLKYSLFPSNPKQLFNTASSQNYKTLLLTSIKEIIREAGIATDNLYEKFSWLDIYYTSRYPSFLFTSSIKHFMEERTFIFDNELYDFYLNLPLEFRSDKKLWVDTIAKLDADVAHVENANTGLTPFLPPILDWGITFIASFLEFFEKKMHIHLISPAVSNPAHHPTSGWPNMAELLRTNQKLKELTRNILEDPECIDPQIFDVQRIRKLFIEHCSGEADHSSFFYLLITFGRWHKIYGPNANRSD